MRSEGGSNVDRGGEGERDKPHSDGGFQWSKKRFSGVASNKPRA